jgi:hypothetical protein
MFYILKKGKPDGYGARPRPCAKRTKGDGADSPTQATKKQQHFLRSAAVFLAAQRLAQKNIVG